MYWLGLGVRSLVCRGRVGCVILTPDSFFTDWWFYTLLTEHLAL